MTNQTKSLKCLYGSPAGARLTGFFTLTVAAILMTAAGGAGLAQDQPAGAQPAKPAPEAAKAAQPAPAHKPTQVRVKAPGG